VICEIMSDDGSMARLPELLRFARKHRLRICSIADLIQFRRTREKLVERVEVVKLPTEHGDFMLHLYRSKLDGQHHLALVCGEVAGKRNVLVRVHSECLTGDVFGSRRCDCGTQLHQAMRQVAAAGCGVVLYMRQEGRGIGLAPKIKAYKLQEQGLDTVEANRKLGFEMDLREYGLGLRVMQPGTCCGKGSPRDLPIRVRGQRCAIKRGTRRLSNAQRRPAILSRSDPDSSKIVGIKHLRLGMPGRGPHQHWHLLNRVIGRAR